jgi:uncharacterized integral membrane protein
MRLVLVLLVIVMGMLATFAIQNPGIIPVKFFTLSGNTSLLVVIVAAFGAGLLVGFLPGIPSSLRRRRRIRELESELAAQRKPQPPPPPATP